MSRQREPFQMARHERGYEKGYYRKCFGEEETWADHCTMGRNIIVGLVHPEAVRAPTGGPDCRPCFPSGSLVGDGTDDVRGLELTMIQYRYRGRATYALLAKDRESGSGWDKKGQSHYSGRER